MGQSLCVAKEEAQLLRAVALPLTYLYAVRSAAATLLLVPLFVLIYN